MVGVKLQLPIVVTWDGASAVSGSKILNGALERLGHTITDAAMRLARELVVAIKDTALASLKAASDVEEMKNKFDVVFKGMTEQAMIWARTLQDSYFMSREESYRFLASIQDLLVPMGMNREAAGKLSFEIVKLAADMGSFNNLPTEEVLHAIQSALVGEFETMRKFGVVLNETRVKQEAMNMGFVVGKGVLDPLVRTQAAYSLILKGTKDAQGDLERSGDSYANQLRLLKARFNDILATLGEYLIPHFADLFNILSNLAVNAMPIINDFSMWIADEFEHWSNIIKDVLAPALAGITQYFLDNKWDVIWGDILIIMEELLIDFVVFIAETILKIGSTFIEGLGNIFDFVDEQAKGPWNNSWAAFWDKLYINLVNFGVQVWNWIGPFFIDLGNLQVNFLNKVIDFINPWIKKVGDQFVGFLNGLIKAYNNTIGRVWGDQLDEITNFSSQAIGHLDNYTMDYKQRLTVQTDAMKNSHNNRLSFFKEWAQKRIDEGKILTTNILADHEKRYTAAEAKAANFANSQSQSGTEAATNYAEGYEAGWNGQMEPFYENAFDDFQDTMEGFQDTSYDEGKEAGEQYGKGFTDGFDSFTSGWSGSDSIAGGLNPQVFYWDAQDPFGKEFLQRWMLWFGNWYSGASYDQGATFSPWHKNIPTNEMKQFWGVAHTGGIFDAMQGLIQSFHNGGMAREGLAWVQEGEGILNRETVNRIGPETVHAMNRGGGLISEREVHVHFHGFLITPDAVQEAGNILGPELDRRKKRGY